MQRARGFLRNIAVDVAAAVRLTVRCYPAVAGPVLVVALLDALTYSPGRVDILAAIAWIAVFVAWLWSVDTVYGIYVRGGRYADGARPATVRELVAAAWAVGWPAMAFSVVVLLVTAAVPHALVAVTSSAVPLFFYALPFAAANLLAGWAFTYVVTDDARPGIAGARTYAAFFRGSVAMKTIVVAAVLLLAVTVLHDAAVAAAHGVHVDRIPLTRPEQQRFVQEALLIMVDLIWWPFAYALVLTSRPIIDHSGITRRGGSGTPPPARRDRHARLHELGGAALRQTAAAIALTLAVRRRQTRARFDECDERCNRFVDGARVGADLEVR